jgi:hypothetical protein
MPQPVGLLYHLLGIKQAIFYLSGSKPLERKLVPGAVPSQFAWSKAPTPAKIARDARVTKRLTRISPSLPLGETVNVDLLPLGGEVTVAADGTDD